jgi:hypothetical protein
LISIRRRVSSSRSRARRKSWRAVDRAAHLVAERVQQEPEVAEAEGRVGVNGEDDQLGVESGVLGSDGLGTDLGEVPVAARLGPFVPIVGARVPELHGEDPRLVQIGLQGGAQY